MAEDYEAALDAAQRWVGTVPGVVAVGQGEQDGRPTIDVWVSRPLEPDALPAEQDGHHVRVRDSGGGFRAL